ncbi:helix-turn-helix transcriptional regulator [Lysobacter sp. M2-1]|uniref:helix-turn-helix domain-containing protein n=1 Tax=Lysobacter sp. M2-1 TaxID=2916839 RepID=UPI001F571146|nr:helix-turn-helix transcriptional regulator [Lysobacter sp. M2-1]
MPTPTARALFAARLKQARELRGLSQRALGVRLGLGPEKGSSRINRYEHQVTAVGFDNLERLAAELQVPVAYLLAENEAMAEAILAFSRSPAARRRKLARAIAGLAANPQLLDAVAAVYDLPDGDRTAVLEALSKPQKR